MQMRVNERISWLRPAAIGLLVVGLLGAWATPAEAQQRRGRIDRGLLKNSPSLFQAVGDLASAAALSTVRLLVDDKPVALGTIVRDDGILLTKASELADGFEVELPDGRRVGGTILGVLKEHDLAAVKVEATGLSAASFDASAVNAGQPGAWLLTPGVGDEGLLAVGNLSIQGLRRIPSSGIMLGVLLGEAQLVIPVYEVEPGSAAERAGIRDGDLIVGVNGAPVSTMQNFRRMLRNAPANATFALLLSRNGEAVTASVTLSGGQLGVVLVTEAEGVPIAQVTTGSGAEAAGLRPGDIILAVDERVVRDRDTLIRMISGYRAGDRVEITYLREGEEHTVEATLGYRANRSPRGIFQNAMGSRISTRAVDFPAVLQHDSVLHAEQMGGPLVDVEGRVLGINIARAGRVETYALPAQVIQAALPELLSGKLPTTTAPATSEAGEAPPETPLQE